MASQIQGAIGGLGSGAAAGTAIAPGLGTAIAPGLGTAIGGALGAIGGILGSNNDDSDAAKAAYAQAQSIIASTGAPPDMARQILLQQYQQSGVLTPQLEQQINSDPSLMNKVMEDTQLKQNQMDVLNQWKQRAAGGLTPEEKAQLVAQQGDQERQQQADQASILQGAQQRGQAGGGAALAAMLTNSQSGANRAQTAGLNIGGQANQAAMAALQQYGNQAGALQSQGLNLASAKAQAQDQMNRFNTTNQLAQQQRNVATQNAAQLNNLQRQQGVADVNTGQANAEQQRERQGAMQTWQAQDQLNAQKANALTGYGNNLMGQQQMQDKNNQAMWNSFPLIGKAIGQSGVFGTQKNTPDNQANQNQQERDSQYGQ